MGGWYDTAWEYMIEEGGIEALANYPYRARKFECQADSNMYECTITGCVGGPHTICENSGLNGDEEEFKKMLNVIQTTNEIITVTVPILLKDHCF